MVLFLSRPSRNYLVNYKIRIFFSPCISLIAKWNENILSMLNFEEKQMGLKENYNILKSFQYLRQFELTIFSDAQFEK